MRFMRFTSAVVATSALAFGLAGCGASDDREGEARKRLPLRTFPNRARAYE